MAQSKLYSRLRLNPVPESLNSPDVPVPTNRPAQRDDPMNKYGRELAASYHSGTVAASGGNRREALMTGSYHQPSHHVSDLNSTKPVTLFTNLLSSVEWLYQLGHGHKSSAEAEEKQRHVGVEQQ